MTVSTTTATDRACPFVGPRPFRLGEPLFGRDREIPKLLDLLIAERIVLLFSPSGAGKTSLIQAGLIPALREEGFHDLPIIRVKQPTPSDREDATREPANRYLRGTLASLESRRPEAPDDPPVHVADLDALGPALQRWADALRPKTDGQAPKLVLIFDQFEELLTTDPTDRAAKEVFFDQLGAVLRDPGPWALFAMREEYAAALEPYLNRIPRRLASRFRLDLLDDSSAREAFKKPFESRNVAVAPEAATRLVDDLRRVHVQRPDGTSEVVLGPHVEPVHLQIVGLRLWNRYGSDPAFTRLDETHLSGTESGVDAALAGYYADTVLALAERFGVTERAIRDWCETQLITDQGLRGQVLRAPGSTRGLPEPVIEALRDAFLVRAEDRRGSTWYELAHDRLIEPVRKDNQKWRQQHLHPLLHLATDWDRAGRLDSLLLPASELKAVESWRRANDRFLTDAEREFLDRSSQAQLDLEARQRTTELIIDRGISLCQQGRADDGLLWLIRGLKQVHATDPPDPLDHLARFAIAAWQTQITSLRWFQQLDGRVHAVAFSPDGCTALTGSGDGTARLWTVQAQEPIGLPLNHGGSIPDAIFSPDDTMVLTCGRDGTVRLWLAMTQRSIGALFSHRDMVEAVAFSPDGRWIATASWDGTAQLWRTPAAVEGSLERLEHWIHVVTRKEMDELDTVRSIDLNRWQNARQELDRLGGPFDEPAAREKAVSRAR